MAIVRKMRLSAHKRPLMPTPLLTSHHVAWCKGAQLLTIRHYALRFERQPLQGALDFTANFNHELHPHTPSPCWCRAMSSG